MKLVFVIKALDNIGGTERVTIQIANLLSMRSHEVHIVSLVGNNKPFFEVLPEVKLHYIHQGADNSIFPYRDLRRHYRLKNCFASINPDIIIVVDASRATFKIPACKPYTTIYWEHFNSLMKSKPMQVLSRKLVSKHGSWVVTLTEADALSYKQKYNTNKVSCIHNPITIDLPEYTPPTQHKAVAVGRYTNQKGFDLLLEAWAIVEDKKDWQLLIVGKGKSKQTKLLSSLIDKYNLSETVKLLPPTNNIQGLYKDSGMYVMSSRFEGLPLVLIEAAAMGLPAVSFACQTGPEEIIEHEKTGLLVPPLNIDALASAIQTCILNDNLRIEFSKNAASYVGEKFSTENIIDKWESLFNQLKQS